MRSTKCPSCGVQKMSPKEFYILARRLSGAGGRRADATFETIGREIGLSRERARQLERRAFLKVRDMEDHSRTDENVERAWKEIGHERA